MEVIVRRGNKVVAKGEQEDVKEKIEDMLFSEFGFFVDLQESMDDGEFEVYLHTDNYDQLEDYEIDFLDSLRVSDNPEETTKRIKEILGVEFSLVDKSQWRSIFK